MLHVAGTLAAASFGRLASSGLCQSQVPVLWGFKGFKILVQCGDHI